MPQSFKVFKKIVIVFLGLLVVLYTGVSWYILKITITPRVTPNTITPDQLGLEETEFITFKSPGDGTRLEGWLVPADRHRVVLLVHGIHSQAWDGSLVDLVHGYRSAGIDVFLFDLRGHGRSGGKYVGLGLRDRDDVRAAVEELLARGYESGKIGIHGISFGAAVTLLAAPEIKEFGAVIADSSFANMKDVVAGEIQREAGLPGSVAKIFLVGVSTLARILHSLDINESAPEKVIAQISPRPVLLIHGTDDETIPFDQAKRLLSAGGPSVELWALEGYRHAEGIRLHPGYPEWSPMREKYLLRAAEFFKTNL